MSTLFLVLKWLSQFLIVTSGVYAMFSDLYKEDEHTKKRQLTGAGWINLATLLAGLFLFGITDFKERKDRAVEEVQSQARYKTLADIKDAQDNQLNSQRDELGYLHHLILEQESVEGWEISWESPQKVMDAARSRADTLTGKEDSYLRSCLRNASIEARRSVNEHWVVTCELGRPQGVLNLSFDISPTQPGWAVFESILDVLLSSRFSLSQSGGEDFILLTRLERPDQISYGFNKVVVTVRSSHVKLSRLEQPVPVVLRFDRETLSETPASVRIRSIDPNLTLDKTIPTKWTKRQVGTKPHYPIDPGDEPITQEPIFAYFSGPHELGGTFNQLLFSFEKNKGSRRDNP